MSNSLLEGWQELPLGRVATLQRGFDLPIQERKSGLVPIYGSNGIDGWHSVAAVKGPGVVTGRSGSIGSVYYTDKDFWPLNTALYVSDFHGNYPLFIARLLELMDLKRFSASTGIPSLNRNFVHPSLVLKPTYNEQRTIATILDTIDNAIQQTEIMIAKLQLVKTGLLHDLLTCGLDENGELRDPIRHPEQFKDSPLGRIPNCWDTVTLAGISDFITSGSRGWAQYYAADGPLFLRIGNLTREHINLRFDDVVHVSPPRGSEGGRTRVVPGDLLVSITADLGIIGCAPDGIGEAYVNQHVALARLNSDVNSRWVAHYLASPMYQHRFQYSNDAGAKAGMNLTSVGNLVIAIPRAEESALAVDILDKNDDEIAALKVDLRKHLLLKQGLMRDLLTGAVSVKDIAA